MSLNPSLFRRRLDSWRESTDRDIFRDIRVGLEREALRVDEDAALSRKPHPAALGSPLTHPHITTDYSEVMIELVTPPAALEETHAFLADLHRYVHVHLGPERLWCGSMPCVIAGDPDIPLAYYGESNPGRMKTVYRRGLGYRYTRSMQVISGVHFNCSVPAGFWRLEFGGWADPDRISERYFDGVRNLLRFGWLVAYLFGASPAICRSFVLQKHESLEMFTPGTYYGPYATSLRQGSIGYQNSQEVSAGVRADYNSRKGYIESLRAATSTPCPRYRKIGVRSAGGEYRQLNANQLQIENEYYSPVRPKCVPRGNERPTRGLRRRGVEYLELRSLDIDPFEPCGIGIASMRFLTALVLYCLLDDSPKMSESEQADADDNMRQVAHHGRDLGATLRRGEEVSLRDWASELLRDVREVCGLLDEVHGGAEFLRAWETQEAKLRDPGRTPSGRMVSAMRESGEAYVEWALRRSREHWEFFRNRPPDPDLLDRLDRVAERSRERQRAIEEEERESPVSFEDYLAAYEAQA